MALSEGLNGHSLPLRPLARFRSNLRRLADYPRLLAYTGLYALPGVAETVILQHVRRHYWDDHEMINRRILPIGPPVDFEGVPATRAA